MDKLNEISFEIIKVGDSKGDIFKATNMLRINMCKRRDSGGQLEQMYFSEQSGKQVWRPVQVGYYPENKK